MSLIGKDVGVYRITAWLGAGGMGEVYCARDTRLERDVAIKILPEEFSKDPERLRRFDQEARAAAALNHPNVLAVFDIGVQDGAPFVVSELLKGTTLAGRLRSAPIHLRKTIDYALQIARGLAAAHGNGIIHRDLKPDNIFVTDDGHVKILDFGLAKLIHQDRTTPLNSTMATGAANTQAGAVLGTLSYMSPEQVHGHVADPRADIFAFGVVLYEMLTGRRAFDRETVFETMTAIVKEDVPELPAVVPDALDRVLRRCLEKHPAARFGTAADLVFALETVASGTDSRALPDRSSGSRVFANPRLAWFTAALLGLSTAALLVFLTLDRRQRPSAQNRPITYLDLTTQGSSEAGTFALSPDGRKFVFSGVPQSRTRLFLRRLDMDAAIPLEGTELTGYGPPFWSPDSEAVAFFADGELKRIDVGTRIVRTLARAPNNRGGTANSAGVIVFAPNTTGPLYKVLASSGSPVAATQLQAGQTGHRFPSFLPDGRHFVFFAVGIAEKQGVYLASLDSGADATWLLESDTAAVFAPPDYLLFARKGTLLAQNITLDNYEITGEPQPVAAEVAVRPGTIGSVAVSAAVDAIAYRSTSEIRQLAWLDRGGQQVGTIGEPDAGQMRQFSISRDQHSILMRRTTHGNTDIWRLDVARGTLNQVTTHVATEYNPVWSPDGRRVLFTSDRNGSLDDLYITSADGSGAEELLLKTDEFKNSIDWSPDGRFVIFLTQNEKTGSDLWALPLTGDRKPFPIAQTRGSDNAARISPDGQWIVYQSNEGGRNGIYLQPFGLPGPVPKTFIAYGNNPEWRRDGRELFYISDRQLMVVPMSITGAKGQPGKPAPLFQLTPGTDYVPAPDGQRFLVNEIVEPAAPIRIVLNWTAGLKK